MDPPIEREVYVNQSTTLVQVDTSQVPGTIIKNIVRLSSVNTPGNIITIRDIAGSASRTNPITISTTKDVKFLDGEDNNKMKYEITQPYGFLTVTPRDTRVWAILNTFAFPDASDAANVIDLTAKSITVTKSHLNTALISTALISTLSTDNVFIRANLSVGQSTIAHAGFFTCSIRSLEDLLAGGTLYAGSTVSSMFGNITSTLTVPYISTQNIEIYGVLRSASTISTMGPLFVGSSISTTGNLAVGGSTFVQGELHVMKNVIFQSSLSTLYSLGVGREVMFYSSLTVKDDILTNGHLSTMSNTNVGGALSVMKSAFFTGHVSTQSNLTVGGALSVMSSFYTYGTVVLNSSLHIRSEVSTLSNVYIASSLSVGRNLAVYGDIFFNDRVLDLTNLSVNQDLFVNNNISTYSSITAGQDLRIMGSTFLIGPVSTLSNMNVGGGISTMKDLAVTGASYFASTVVFQSSISSLANVMISGHLSTLSSVVIGHNLEVNRDLNVLSSLKVFGSTMLQSSVYITGSLSVFSSIAVACNLDVGNFLNVRSMTSDNLQSKTFSVTNQRDFVMNISSSTLHYGLFSSFGGMNIGGPISTTNTLAVGSTLNAQFMNITMNLSTLGNAYIGSSIFALSNIQSGASTIVNGGFYANNQALFANSVRIDRNLLVQNKVDINGVTTIGADTEVTRTLTVRAGLVVSNEFDQLPQNRISNDTYMYTLKTSSLTVYANQSTFGQASFYSSIQVQGHLSVFSTLSAACNADVAGLLTASSIATRSLQVSTMSLIQQRDYVFNVSSSTLHAGLFSTSGEIFSGRLISTMSSLAVGDHANFYRNVTIGGNTVTNGILNVGGATTLSNTLTVVQRTTLTGNVGIGGSPTNENGLSVTGSTKLTGNVGIGAAPNDVNKLYVDGNTRLVGTLGVTGNTTLTGTLAVSENTTLSKDLNVGQKTTMTGNVGIGASPNDVNKLYVDGNTAIRGPLGVNGNTTLTGTLAVSENTTLSKTLNVGEKTTMTGNVGIGASPNDVNKLYVDGNTAIAGPLGVTGNTTLTGTLSVSENTTLSKTLNVGQKTTMTGNVGIGASPNDVNKLYVDGNTAIAGPLGVTGTLAVSENTTLSKTLTVIQGTTHTGNVGIGASSNGTNALFVNGTTQFNGNVGIKDDANNSHALNVNGTILACNILAVSTTLQSNLFVPNIYNSSLQTSSILASTVTSKYMSIDNLYAITGLIQNMYSPFIYNSSLQTSSILTSTIITNLVSSGVENVSSLIVGTLRRFLVVGSITGTMLVTNNYGTSYSQGIQAILQSLNAMATNAKLVVAVGTTSSGTDTPILYSSNGMTWTRSSGSTLTSANDVIWTGTQFVAVGNVFAVSPDGITWTDVTFPTSIGVGLKVGFNGYYYLIGTTANKLYKYNPSAGTNIEISTLFTYINKILWTGSVWLIGGDGSYYLVSYDGNSLTQINRTSLVRGIASNGSTVVAVGGLAVSYTSGSTWTHVLSGAIPDSPSSLNDVIWDGTNFVAFFNGGNKLARSLDGRTWTAASTDTPSATVLHRGIAFRFSAIQSQANNGLLVTDSISTTGFVTIGDSLRVGQSTLVVQDSTRSLGVNCNSPSYSVDVDGTINAKFIYQNGLPYQPAPTTGEVTIVNLTTSTITVGKSASIVNTTVPTTFIIAGLSGSLYKLYTGSSPVNMTLTSSGIEATTRAFNTAYYTGTSWYLGGEGASSAVLYSSPNSLSWSQVSPSGTFPNKAVNSIVYNGLYYLICGKDTSTDTATSSSRSIVKSTDMITFTASSTTAGSRAFTTEATAAAWNGSVWVAVGSDVTLAAPTTYVGPSIKYSDDGIIWKPTTGAFGAATSATASIGYTVVWNGVLFVAGGADTVCTLKYSTNGITWTNCTGTYGTTTTTKVIVWSGKRFVAVQNSTSSGQNIIYSDNGITWSRSTQSITNGSSLVWTGSQFVLGTSGSSAALYTSPNGLTWALQTQSPAYDSALFMNSLSYSSNTVPDLKLANTNFFSKQPQIQGSVSTTNTILSLSNAFIINNLCSETSGKVGIKNNNPQMELDVNGNINFTGTLNSNGNPVNFTPAGINSVGNVAINKVSAAYPLDVNGNINFTGTLNSNGTPVNFSPAGINSVGNIGINKVSPAYPLDVNGNINFTGTLNSNGNPVNFTPAGINSAGNVGINKSSGAYALDVNGVARVVITVPSDSLCICMGRTGTTDALYSSADGTTWTKRYDITILPNHNNRNRFKGICWDGTRWIFMLQGNTILTSPDGTIWTTLANVTGLFNTNDNAPFYVNTLIYTGTYYFAGLDGRVARSSDCITWTWSEINGLNSPVLDFAYNNNILVAVGTSTQLNAVVQYSTDNGITWTNTSAPTNDFAACVATNGSIWVVGYGKDDSSIGGILWSLNGKTSYTVGTNTFNAKDIAWNGTCFVAVGKGPNNIRYSYDGKTWINSSSSFSSTALGEQVIWNGSLFIAVGRTGVEVDSTGSSEYKSSPDGITWTDIITSGAPSVNARAIAVKLKNTEPNLQVQNLGIYATGQATTTVTNTMKLSGTTMTLNDTLSVKPSFVGINCTPTVALDVNGSINTNSNITANGTITTNNIITTGTVIPGNLSSTPIAFVGSATGAFRPGIGASAVLDTPIGLEIDKDGTMYVVNCSMELFTSICKITPAGVVTLLAGSLSSGYSDGQGSAASFTSPLYCAIGPDGSLYVTDGIKIRKVTMGGVVSTVYTGTGINGICIDSSGTIYFSDASLKIYKLTGSTASVFVGSGTFDIVDGTGIAASFYGPGSLAIDSQNNIYAADLTAVRKITPGGIVTTLAGSTYGGYSDGQGSAASFIYIFGMTFDTSGNLYACDMKRIRKITPDGFVSTVLISSSPTANLNDLKFDFAGNLFFTDSNSSILYKLPNIPKIATNVIRYNVPSNIPIIFAGSGVFSSLDGIGTAATFAAITQVASGSDGTLYVFQNTNPGKIRKITQAGVVTTLATLPGNSQTGAIDAEGNVYCMNGSAISKVTPAGVITLVAGNVTEAGYINGTGAAARLRPRVMALGVDGNLYVSDAQNYCIRKIVIATGVVTTFAGALPVAGTDLAGYVGQVGTSGFVNAQGTNARFSFADSIISGIDGNLYMIDTTWFSDSYGNSSLRKITLDGVVTTIAGSSITGYVDGVGTQARFKSPQGLTTDALGNFYIVDGNQYIRKVTPSGVVSTFYNGIVETVYYNMLGRVYNICIDKYGNLFYGEYDQNVIKKFPAVAYYDATTTITKAYSSTLTANIITNSNLYITQSIDNKTDISRQNIPMLVAIGDNDGINTQRSMQYSTDDGLTWKNCVSGGFMLQGMRGVLYNGSIWVALGQNGSNTEGRNTQWSTDGINWNYALTGETDQAWGIALGWNGKMWLASYNECLQTSFDGKNWTKYEKIQTSTSAIAWSDKLGLWVAAGLIDTNVEPADTRKTLKWSTNGVTWNNALSGGFVGPVISGAETRGGYGVAWNGSYFIAVGAGSTIANTILKSTDGKNWTNCTAGGCGVQGYGVAWSKSLGLWVVSGKNVSVTSGQFRTSTDGETWIDTIPTSGVWGQGGLSDADWKGARFVTWTGTSFIAGKSDSTKPMVISKDGNNWYPTKNNFLIICSAVGVGYGSETINTLATVGNTKLLGNVFIGSSNVESPGSAVTTYAGSDAMGSTNGTGTSASFENICCVASDTLGRIYVSQKLNGAESCIRRIDNSVVTTLFNISSTDSGWYAMAVSLNRTVFYTRATTPSFNTIISRRVRDGGLDTYTAAVDIITGRTHVTAMVVSINDTNRLYFVDNYGIFTYYTGSTSTHIAGSVATSGNINAYTGTNARFGSIYGICLDSTETYMYISDSTNNTIRRMSLIAPYEVTTYAGTGIAGFVNGFRLNAQFREPFGIAFDSNNNIYISDKANHSIRFIDTVTGIVYTAAGRSTSGTVDGIGERALFENTRGLTVNTDGYVYIGGQDRRIRRMSPFYPNIASINGTVNINTGPDFRYALNVGGNVCMNSDTIYIGRYNTNTNRNLIRFSGTYLDGGLDENTNYIYTTTVIGERVYSGDRSSELILFKGNDGGTDLDRVRVLSAGGFKVDIADINDSGRWRDGYDPPAVYKEAFIVTREGRVGIGTQDPVCPLHVETTQSITFAAFVANSAYGTNGTFTPVSANQSDNVAIKATGIVWTTRHFIAQSDERIKKNIKPVTDSLDIVNKLNVVSFDYIDFMNKPVKHGLIAQEVKKVYPEAVNIISDYIPSVYNVGTYAKADNLTITSSVPHGFVVKDKIKLYINQDGKVDTRDFEYNTEVLEVLSDTEFIIKPWENFVLGQDLFIFGKQVDDFLGVDKPLIGLIAAGACKILSEKVNTQATEIETLKTTLDIQAAEIASLKASVAAILEKISI